MRDLYFTLSTYGGCLLNDKIQESLDSNEFAVLVYGQPVDPRKNKMDFNSCRWQVAELNCTYIDFKAKEEGYRSSAQTDYVKEVLGTDKNILFIDAVTAIHKDAYHEEGLLDLLNSLQTLIPAWLSKLGRNEDCNVYIAFTPEDYYVIDNKKSLLDPSLELRDELYAILM